MIKRIEQIALPGTVGVGCCRFLGCGMPGSTLKLNPDVPGDYH